MPKIKQPVIIGGLEFDALISEDRGLSSTVPEYSVDNGFNVSDAIIIGAETLSMTLFVTDTPVTWYERHGAWRGRTEEMIKRLEELFYSATPLTISTANATYPSMAIESLTLSKTTEAGYSREIPISFKKVRITSSKTTTIPANYGKSGTTGQNAGVANVESGSSGGTTATTPEEGSKSSILYSAASSFGLIGG